MSQYWYPQKYIVTISLLPQPAHPLLARYEYKDRKAAQERKLEPRVVVHEDGHGARVRHEPLGASHNVASMEPQLPGIVQPAVVRVIIVSLCEDQLLAAVPAGRTTVS